MRIFKPIHGVFLLPWTIFLGLTAGLLTNWFRYSPSLSSAIVLLVLVVVTVVELLLWFVFLRNTESIGSLLASLGGGMAVVLTANYWASGAWYPDFYLKHVVKSPLQDVEAWGDYYQYRLELENPFSRFHREKLVVVSEGKENVVTVPLYDEPVRSYLSPARGSDWVSLVPKEEYGKFSLKTSSYLKPGLFEYDLVRGTVTRSDVEEAER